MTPDRARRVRDHAELMHSPEAVNAAVDRLATAIGEQLHARDPVFLTVMNGGLIFAGMLAPRLPMLLEMDYLEATRYRGTAGATLKWRIEPALSLAGRTVLIVDDILDEGYTLRAVQRYCDDAGVAAHYTAVLVNKRHSRGATDVRADFVGLEVDDRYVVGCGMDYRGRLRNLPGIYAIHPEDEGG